MPLSGEAIRLMNYVDDVTVTLRKVMTQASTLPAEERNRLAEHLKTAKPSIAEIISTLEAR
jgi:hypothetical protein